MDGNPVSPTVTPNPTLKVEVDFVENTSWDGNGDPSAIRNDNNVSVLTAISYNYKLYGIDVVFGPSDDQIERSALRDICKGAYENSTGLYSQSCLDANLPGFKQLNITTNSLNRNELVRIEDKYHDNPSRVHMLWGTTLGNDQPKTLIDSATDYGSSTGLARHVGSPKSHHVYVFEPNEFGIMVARDSFTSHDYRQLQSVAMHELGHALSIGWRDDTEPPHDLAGVAAPNAYEVYSGNQKRPNLTGGLDPTLENVSINGDKVAGWTIMKRGYAPNSKTFTRTSADFPVLLLSIEELSTADFKHIPSKKEEK